MYTRRMTRGMTFRLVATMILLLAGVQVVAASPTAGNSTTANTHQPDSSATDLTGLLPSPTDIPDDLVLLDSQVRTLDAVVTNYADPALATQNFTTWGWKGNAIRSFGLSRGQRAQSGVLNGVYVSIHEFDSPKHAKAALDFSLAEQQVGQPLDEVDVGQFGEYSRGLYGLLDYGYETTILVQQGNLLIRVSAAELNGDPTAKTQAIISVILAKDQTGSTSPRTGNASAGTTGPTSTTSEDLIDDFVVWCQPKDACYNATITITTEDGQFISSGTCPGAIAASQWLCHIPDVPRGIQVVLIIDNVAPGYVAEQNPLYWDTTIEPVAHAFGEKPVFTFDTTDGRSSESVSAINDSLLLYITSPDMFGRFRSCRP